MEGLCTRYVNFTPDNSAADRMLMEKLQLEQAQRAKLAHEWPRMGAKESNLYRKYVAEQS